MPLLYHNKGGTTISVRQDKARKTWMAKVSYMDDLGVRRYKTKRGFKTKREAKDWESEFLKKIKGSSDMTFASLVEVYMEDCSHRLRLTTLAGKKFLIDSKIIPFLGHKSIQEIDPKDIRKWQNWLLSQKNKNDKPLSQTYIKTINNQLSAIFNFAVKFYGLKTNPIRMTGSIGRKTADSMQFWTREEFDTFIEVIDDKPDTRVAFSLLFYSGIRVGELLALTLSDFDLEANTVSITKSFSRLSGQDIISEPKTPKSKRVITLPGQIVEMVVEYASKLPYYEDNQRLFMRTKHFFTHEMDRGCRKSGVKRIRVHDLRHSHASLLIELGVSPLAISERLGHEDIQTTLNTYSHLYPDAHNEVARKLEGVIEGSQQNKKPSP